MGDKDSARLPHFKTSSRGCDGSSWAKYLQAAVSILRAVRLGCAVERLAREDSSSATDSSKKSYLVLEVGVEPTCPVKGAGF